MSSITLANDTSNVVLKVYSGSCLQLAETGEHVAIPKEFLPQNHENCALQKSGHDGIFWLLYRGRRFESKFFCSACGSVLNGSGSNITAHLAKHKGRTTFTQQQCVNALFSFS